MLLFGGHVEVAVCLKFLKTNDATVCWFATLLDFSEKTKRKNSLLFFIRNGVDAFVFVYGTAVNSYEIEWLGMVDDMISHFGNAKIEETYRWPNDGRSKKYHVYDLYNVQMKRIMCK